MEGYSFKPDFSCLLRKCKQPSRDHLLPPYSPLAPCLSCNLIFSLEQPSCLASECTLAPDLVWALLSFSWHTPAQCIHPSALTTCMSTNKLLKSHTPGECRFVQACELHAWNHTINTHIHIYLLITISGGTSVHLLFSLVDKHTYHINTPIYVLLRTTLPYFCSLRIRIIISPATFHSVYVFLNCCCICFIKYIFKSLIVLIISHPLNCWKGGIKVF